MSKQINLTGQRFGKLVAVRPVPSAETKDHRQGWLVRCDCGKEKIVNGSNLRRGLITSCGCERGKHISKALKNAGLHEDITGQTFGELTALKYLHTDYWLWKCSCGKETKARPSQVKAGKIQSCGHVLSETAAQKIRNNVLRHFDGTSIPHIQASMSGKLRKNNTTGAVGVKERHYSGGVTVWTASITVKGQYIYLGQYATFEGAVEARKQAEKKYFSPILADYAQRKK